MSSPALSSTRPRPLLALIAAVARNGAIGKGNELLWRESADQKRFRQVTMGCPVIMGRRTWESLPARFRPLPGRRNVVLTRDRAWRDAGAEPQASLDAALAALQGAADRIFVIGGGELYAQALPRADELVLTEIDTDFDDADTYFPAWDRQAYAETSREHHVDPNGVGYSFVTYQRVHRHV
ncbi:MAG: dihydrofolate reductase [Proteobacteria bacterium]|nr:dihydrofolate reductase [Pseudomonadota bacterium]